jgi:cell wall-associated NlpC family hydrolase
MTELAFYAMSLSDTSYQFGGTTPANGFDCSGFVVHVFKHSADLTLPRTSQEISKSGLALDSEDLSPGDLVFYDTQHAQFSHVGIYIGDSKFVHAPRTGSRVKIERMGDKYWASRYNGARRITE